MDRMMAAVVNMSAAVCTEAVSSCANIAIVLDTALLVSFFVALLSLRLCSLLNLLVLYPAYRLKADIPSFA